MAKWQVYKRVITKTLLIIALAVTINNKGYSQFIVTQQPTVEDYFSVLIPQSKANRFQFLALRDVNQSQPTRKNHQIMTYDFSGQLLDSVNIPRGFSLVGFPLKSNGYFYWSGVYLDTLTAIGTSQDAFVLKFDSLFNCIEQKKLNNLSQTIEIPSNVIKINNKLFVAVKNFINNELKFYCLDNQLNKRDSVTLSGFYNVSELRQTFDNRVLIAGNGFPPIAGAGGGAQKIIMDTLLNINTVFNLDSLTYVTAGGSVVTGCSSQIGVDFLYFRIIPITSSKNFILGHYDVVYNATCNYRSNLVHTVIDNNNQIIKTTLISDSIRDIKYADNVNNVDFKNNNIYSVGSAGFSGGILQTNNSNILVCKSDTMGNLIWKKSYGDDMFYRPISIIQTLDSGFLVSGLRYNYQSPAYLGIGENFILRLDKNGDMISTGIKDEENKNYNSFKFYPNPSKDFIKIDVPFVNEYEVYVYNVLGELLMQEKKFKNLTALNTQALSTGTYILKIKTKDTWLSGKFINE
jgi:hypothetical protein